MWSIAVVSRRCRLLVLHDWQRVVTCVALNIMQPFTTTLTSRPALIEPSAVNDKVKGESEARGPLSPDREGRVREQAVPLRCVWPAVVFFRAGSPRPHEGGHVVSVCSGKTSASQHWSCSVLHCDITGLLTTSLLKRLTYVWSCWVVGRLWNRARMQKPALQLRPTVGFWPTWVVSTTQWRWGPDNVIVLVTHYCVFNQADGLQVQIVWYFSTFHSTLKWVVQFYCRLCTLGNTGRLESNPEFKKGRCETTADFVHWAYI